MSLEEGRAYKEELRQALLAEGKDVADLNADSFDDLTDRENPDFFYVSGARCRVNLVQGLTWTESYRLFDLAGRINESAGQCTSFFSLTSCMDKPVTLLCRAIVISSYLDNSDGKEESLLLLQGNTDPHAGPLSQNVSGNL